MILGKILIFVIKLPLVAVNLFSHVVDLSNTFQTFRNLVIEKAWFMILNIISPKGFDNFKKWSKGSEA